MRLQANLPRRRGADSSLSDLSNAPPSTANSGLRSADVLISLYSSEGGGYDIAIRRLSANTLSYFKFYGHLRSALANNLGVTQLPLLSPSLRAQKLLTSSLNPQRTCPPSQRTLSQAKRSESMDTSNSNSVRCSPRFEHPYIRKRRGSSP